MPAGMLAAMPVTADTDAMIPTPNGPAPRCVAKSGSTGLFETVELNMAKSPVLHNNMNGLNFIFLLIPLLLF